MKIMRFFVLYLNMVQLHYLGVKFWGLKHVRNTGMMEEIGCQFWDEVLACFMCFCFSLSWLKLTLILTYHAP